MWTRKLPGVVHIPTGSIENSQSLNQYSYVQGNPVNLSDSFGLCPEGGGTENVRNLLGHTVLDILGFVPLIGFVFDIANCIWYAKEGQGLMAAACFIAAIPGAGDLVGLGIKALGKGSKALRTAKAVSTTFRMVGAIGQTGLAAINLGIAIDAVVNEYQSSYNGRVSTLSLVNLGASVLGVAVGIHSSKKSIREFKSMWNGMRSKSGSGSKAFARYAKNATRNPDSSEVVLGKYCQDGVSCVQVAKERGATYFQLDNWDEVVNAVGEENIWNINEHFLSQQLVSCVEL